MDLGTFREIDLLIAKHILDYDIIDLGYIAKDYKEKDWDRAARGQPVLVPKSALENPPSDPSVTIHDITAKKIGPPPRFSLDLKSSWFIVTRLAKDGVFLKLEQTEQDLWEVDFQGSVSSGKLLPLAICLAALKNKGVDVSKFEDQ